MPVWFLLAPLALLAAGCLPTKKIGEPPDGGRRDVNGLDDRGRIHPDGPVDQKDAGKDDADMFIPPDAALPPSAPTPLHPADGVTLPPTRAFLAWSGEAPRYVLCHTTEGLEAIEDSDVCPNETPLERPFAVLDPLTASAEYYWKIKACADEAAEICSDFSPIGQFVTDNSVVGWWRFDDPKNLGLDSSGQGNHGDLNGDPTGVSEEGVIGGAVVLNGDDRILIPYSPDLNFTDSMGISVRFLLQTDPRGLGMISQGDGFSLGWRMGFLNEFYPGRITFQVYTMESGIANTGAFAAEDEFHEVTCSYDGSVARCGVNGEGSGEVMASGSFGDLIGEPMSLGAVPTMSSFIGMVDEVILYNAALSFDSYLNHFCAQMVLADPVFSLPPEVCMSID